MLEKDIHESCIKRLELWEKKGVVIHFDDMSNAGRKYVRGRWIMNTKKGRPDIYVYLNVNNSAFIYFVEVKKPTKSRWGDDQIEFSMKFRDVNNTLYEIVTHPNQIDITIERITNFQQNILDNIKL